MTDTARFGRTLLTIDQANKILATNDPLDSQDVTRWVDPNKHVFSQRMASAKASERRLIQGMLLESMNRGETGDQAAGRVSDFLTPLSSPVRNPLSPRSGKGSSQLRALGRTELSRSHGLATIEAAELNPFVAGVKWNLSGAHPEPDECDGKAHGSSRGLPEGVYKPGDVPLYPTHPNCLCFLSQVVIRKTADIVRELLRRQKQPLKDSPFFIADDIDEANVFAREVLGVDVDYADDLQIANLTNRAMWDAKNQGGAMPGRVQVRPFVEGHDGINVKGTYAQYNPSIDTLEINSLEKRFFENDDLARIHQESGWFSHGDRVGLIHHELGHIDHYKTNPRSYTASYYARETDLYPAVSRVSQYAEESLNEFVAEVFSGRLAGRTYDDDVNALYDTIRSMKIRETHVLDAADEMIAKTDEVLNQLPRAAAQGDDVVDIEERILRLRAEKTELHNKLDLVRDELDEVPTFSPRALELKDEYEELVDTINFVTNEIDRMSVLRKIRARELDLPGANLPEIRLPEDNYLTGMRAWLDVGKYQEDIRRANPGLLEPREIQALKDWAGTDISHNWLQNWLRGEPDFSKSGGNDLFDKVFHKIGLTDTDLENVIVGDEAAERLFESTMGSYLRDWDTNLYRAIEKAELPDQVITYRFVKQTDIPLEHPLRNIDVGDTIRTEGYASTTTDIGWLRSQVAPFPEDNIIFELRIPKDAHGIHVDQWTTVPNEREILLPKNTEITILGRIKERIVGLVNPESTIGRQADNLPIAKTQVDADLELQRLADRIGVLGRQKDELDIQFKNLTDQFKEMDPTDPNYPSIIEWRKLESEIAALKNEIESAKKAQRRVQESRLISEPGTTEPRFILTKTDKEDLEDYYGRLITNAEDPGAEDIRYSIRVYNSATYRDLNSYLRTGDVTPEWYQRMQDDLEDFFDEDDLAKMDMSFQLSQELEPYLEELQHYIHHLDRGMDASRSPYDIVSYRGIRTIDDTPFKNAQIGDQILDKGFVSTTLNEDFMGQWIKKWPEGLPTEIYVPKGTKAIYIRGLTGSNIEDEFLLNRNTNFRLAGRLNDRTLLEVVPEDRPFQIPVARAVTRRYEDLSDEAIDDAIKLLNKTPMPERSIAETSRLADLIREQELRANIRVIGRLDPVGDLGIRQLNDIEEARLYDEAKDFWNEIANTDPDIHRAMIDYTRGGFSRANSSKRRFGGVIERDPLFEDQTYIRNIDTNLERLFKEVQTEEDLLIYRQMNQPRGRNILYENPQVGDEFIDHGFISTTVDQDALETIITGTPDRILEIRVPRDTPGQYVRPIGLENEKEMVLGPGLRYRIAGRGDVDPGTGLIKVVLDVVPEPEDIRIARRYSAWPDEINPPDMDSALRNAPIARAQIKSGNRVFRTEQQINDFFDKSIRLAPTPEQKEVLEIRKRVVIDRWRKAQPPPLTTKERMELIERLPRNPTRFQLRRVPYDERPEIRRLIELRHQADELRPDQRRLRIRAIDEQYGRTRTYPRLLTEKEMIDLGEPKISETLASHAERKTITYVDSLGNTVQRKEPISEWYKRLARSQTGGPDLAKQALRSTPDQFARDAQIQLIRDAVDRIWGFVPDNRKPGGQIFLPKATDVVIPRSGQKLLSEAGKPVRIGPDLTNAVIVPRSKNIVPIIIKRKGSSQIERVIIPRSEVPLPPAPVAHARPQGLVLRDILNEGSAPELNTRLRNLEPEDLIRNFEQRLGLSLKELTDEYPTFPNATTYSQAHEIAKDVLQLNLDTGMDRTKPNLYGTIMNQMANGVVENIIRGEPAPRKFVIMGRDEAIMTFGSGPGERAVAAYFPQGDAILFNADHSAFWTADKLKNEYFASGWASAPERISTVVHEMGHWAHFHHDPDGYKYLAQEFDRDEWKAAVQMLDIENRVSRYAASNEREFIAEMYTGIRSGREDLLADDLMEIYEWLGGPSIRGIFDRE